jgi:sec-independent protein translocase protein TatB
MPNMMRAPALRARQRGFFDFSMGELAVIFGLALMVLGPKKLPGLVQQIGRWVGRARHMARQFREQLEQEVNSINAVKPVPRHVMPDVGPAAPGTESAAAEAPSGTAGTEATGVVEPGTAAHESAPSSPPPEPAGSEIHPEGQIYFALNGSEPEVVAQDPYALQPTADDPQAGPEHAEAPPAAPKSPESDELPSVPVVFPHDHG